MNDECVFFKYELFSVLEPGKERVRFHLFRRIVDEPFKLPAGGADFVGGCDMRHLAAGKEIKIVSCNLYRFRIRGTIFLFLPAGIIGDQQILERLRQD